MCLLDQSGNPESIQCEIRGLWHHARNNPAYAGKTHPHALARGQTWDQPRFCGERTRSRPDWYATFEFSFNFDCDVVSIYHVWFENV